MEESKSSASAPEEEPSLFTAAEPSPPEAPPAAPSPPPPPAAPHDAAPAPAPAAAAPADTRRQELLEALAAKQISKVCRIVERLKFDVDAPLNDDGETAVHVCVHHCGTRRDPGFVPVLRCLLRLGANPDAARAGGQMPAHRCAAFDLTPMLALLGAGKEREIPNFKGSDLGRFPLVSADSWTSDRLSERSRSMDAFSGTRARGTLTLKRT